MKNLLMIALLCTGIANAQKIEPVQIGIDKVADSISVSVVTFKTTDKTCSLYYEVYDSGKSKIDDGNLPLTEEEFRHWGDTHTYIEDLALGKLNLTRKQ